MAPWRYSPSYQHAYLPLQQPESLRLFRIHQRDTEEQEIAITMITTSPNETPPYETLSYVWGPLENLVTVICNELPLQIPVNLWECLHSLHERPEVYYWADFICINQQDHAEMSLVIRFMPHIFRRAHRTISWLGTGPELSDSVLALLRQLQLRSREMRHAADSLHNSNGKNSGLDQKGLIKYQSLLPPHDAVVWTDLDAIIDSKYFSR